MDRGTWWAHKEWDMTEHGNTVLYLIQLLLKPDRMKEKSDVGKKSKHKQADWTLLEFLEDVTFW